MRTPLLYLALALALPATAADFPRFRPAEIDKHAGEICYAVCVADVDGDKKPDIVVATEDAVLWYANPSWEKHTIIKGVTERDNVCIQPHDIDGDGRIDFALGAGWRPPDTVKPSTLQWLGRDAGGVWKVHPIKFDEPSMHRHRWGDVLGTGKKQLVVAPLQGRGTKGPNWGDGAGVKILVYSVPDDPTRPDWPVQVADDGLHTVHNLQLVRSPKADAPEFIYAAAREGIFSIFRSKARASWIRVPVGPNGVDRTGARGAGEIKVGAPPGEGFAIATIEPFHGNQVVVYTNDARDPLVSREVVDEPVTWGHALWWADLDGDGGDDLIVGQRDPNPKGGKNPVGPGVWAYQVSLGPPENGVRRRIFTRHDIDDGGIAVEDLVVADLNADGRPEIIAVGRATHNVKIYWNEGMNAKP